MAKRKHDPSQVASEIETLEVHPSNVAERRTTDLLRNLLNAPPDPHIAPAKPAKKKPGKK